MERTVSSMGRGTWWTCFRYFWTLRNSSTFLPADKFDYKLQNEDHHLNFVYTDLTPATSGTYLKLLGDGNESEKISARSLCGAQAVHITKAA